MRSFERTCRNPSERRIFENRRGGSEGGRPGDWRQQRAHCGHSSSPDPTFYAAVRPASRSASNLDAPNSNRRASPNERANIIAPSSAATKNCATSAEGASNRNTPASRP